MAYWCRSLEFVVEHIVRGPVLLLSKIVFYVVVYNHTVFCNMFHILALSFLKYDLARANSKVHQVALAFVGCEIIFFGFRLLFIWSWMETSQIQTFTGLMNLLISFFNLDQKFLFILFENCLETFGVRDT